MADLVVSIVTGKVDLCPISGRDHSEDNPIFHGPFTALRLETDWWLRVPDSGWETGEFLLTRHYETVGTCEEQLRPHTVGGLELGQQSGVGLYLMKITR